MIPDAVDKVRTALAQSPLVQAVQSVKQDGGRRLALGDAPLRGLTPEEVELLERQGNLCDDWSRLRVAEGFDGRRVRQSVFCGDVVLGRFAGHAAPSDGVSLPAGIFRSTVADCVIGTDALVCDVKLLANYVVGPHAVLHDCGTVLCDGPTAFGNGAAVSLGIESGGREVEIFAEVDIQLAATIARSRSDRDLLDRYSRAVSEYVAAATSARGIIETGAKVLNTPKLTNTYMGPAGVVDGATRVGDCTLLSSAEEPVRVTTGACVTRSLLQWGSSVTGMAIVDRSVLTEHSHVELHAKVQGSVLGPNTGIAKGEVTASLLGPFVGFHHQSLLIAAFWPEGKGNISYGANVGSNHTSKAPDQEFWPGEGAFLGLGVNIKYPSNFSRAPYSVVACGVTTLPQKITFPFSLVNLPSAHVPGVPPAYNEIVPAWQLTDNLYSLRRNERKYQVRNQARRTQFEFAIFRPDTLALMAEAFRRLEAVPDVKEAYTDRDIDGLGKNYLLEASRAAAAEAYRFFIRYHTTLALKAEVLAALERGEEAADGLLVTPSDRAAWEPHRQLLHDYLGVADVRSALRELPGMARKIARAVEQSRAKDDVRGKKIIDDYADVHPAAGEDPLVRQTWAEAQQLEQETEALLGRLAGFEVLRNGHPDELPDLDDGLGTSRRQAG